MLRLTMESTRFLADRLKHRLIAGRDLQVRAREPMRLHG
jgi:hypothetical protein